jgi:isopentenyldiphosphate isomerase
MAKIKPIYLDVIDELGNPLYHETEQIIHEQGLLHREIVVWFYTETGGLIFKMRNRNSQLFPEMLDATIGRHLEINKNLDEVVVEAIKKQTYMDISFDKLEYLGDYIDFAEDKMSGLTNSSLNSVYAYYFQRNLNNLMQEMVPGNGFFEFNIKEFDDMDDSYIKRFVCFSEDSGGDASFLAIKSHLKRQNII